MPNLLRYKNVDQKYLITTSPDDIPVGSIIFWHDHRLIIEANKKQPGKHLINPELVAHVGIVIRYDNQYPIIAHAAYEKAKAKSNKPPIQSVISCRLRALDDRSDKEAHSFIVFKPNKYNYDQNIISQAMVDIATNITHRDSVTKKSDYNIPYGTKRAVAMSKHIYELFGAKTKKTKFEKYLQEVTDRQMKETNYAFYHPWPYESDSHKKIITDSPLNMRAAALVPFKSITQYNHIHYQPYQQKNKKTAFTKHGFTCVQFIVWLGQCAMIQAQPEKNKLTHNAKNPISDVKNMTKLSRKYTTQQDENKFHIKRVLLHGKGQNTLYSESDYKDLFKWLDYDGKMMAPGTLLQILMDQSDFGGGGDGEKPFVVDYYLASNEENSVTYDILDEINDLVTTLYQLSLKHKLTQFNTTLFLKNFYAQIAQIISYSNTTFSKIRQNSSVVAESNRPSTLSLFCQSSPEPVQKKFTHHSLIELQYLGITIRSMMSIFVQKLIKNQSKKRKGQLQNPRSSYQIRRLGN